MFTLKFQLTKIHDIFFKPSADQSCQFDTQNNPLRFTDRQIWLMKVGFQCILGKFNTGGSNYVNLTKNISDLSSVANIAQTEFNSLVIWNTTYLSRKGFPTSLHFSPSPTPKESYCWVFGR